MMWVRSFISHFKKIALFAAVVIAVTEVMNYLYVDDTDDFDRYTMHAFYEEKDNIDRLYMGSSHVFCGINPVMLDGINGDNNFNLSTGAQRLNTAYYLLKEADKKHDIDKLYLDLYYSCTVGEMRNPRDDLPYGWLVVNQMKPSLNKLSYMVNLSSPPYYYLTFLAFMRYREQLFNLDYVAGVVEAKQSETWKNHEYRHVSTVDDRKYVIQNGEKGFRISHITPERGGFYRTDQETPLKEKPMMQKPMEYLLKIVEYCRSHDIQLTWIGCPMSNFQLVRNGGYDNYVSQVAALADKYHIPYYDFNLCKEEYLDLSQNKYWADMGHLNTEGADVFTQFMGEFLLAQETGTDTYEDCFYSSYEEKISSAQKAIYGLEIVKSDEYERCLPDIPREQREGYVIYKIHPVTNALGGEVVVDVSLVGRNIDEEVSIIRDENDAYIIFSVEEHGVMDIEAKLKESVEVTNWVQIAY